MMISNGGPGCFVDTPYDPSNPECTNDEISILGKTWWKDWWDHHKLLTEGRVQVKHISRAGERHFQRLR